MQEPPWRQRHCKSIKPAMNECLISRTSLVWVLVERFCVVNVISEASPAWRELNFAEKSLWSRSPLRNSRVGRGHAREQRWGANMLSLVLNIWPGWNLRRAAQLNRRPSGWRGRRGGRWRGRRRGREAWLYMLGDLPRSHWPDSWTSEGGREGVREGEKQGMHGTPAFYTLENNNLPG